MPDAKAVRITGTSPNLCLMPPPPAGTEVWCCNRKGTIRARHNRIITNKEWTRWINLHSREHMDLAYPETVDWYKNQTKPIFLQRAQDDIPSSIAFPAKQIMEALGTPGNPIRFFTCSGAWEIALAIYEGFSRIELWGFTISRHKLRYAFERPCMFYWIDRARREGIDVWVPPEVEWNPDEIGDPHSYNGPIYGYQTKPETPPIILES